MRKSIKTIDDLRKSTEHISKDIPKKRILIFRDTEQKELAKKHLKEFERIHGITQKDYLDSFGIQAFKIQRIPHIAPGIILEDFEWPKDEPQRKTFFTRLKRIFGIK